tara:strand:- start:292 stop:426 length:135 start_codon:yes stop_codon:yes gene_type:complete
MNGINAAEKTFILKEQRYLLKRKMLKIKKYGTVLGLGFQKILNL